MVLSGCSDFLPQSKHAKVALVGDRPVLLRVSALGNESKTCLLKEKSSITEREWVYFSPED